MTDELLVRSLLILICIEFEKIIKDNVRKKCVSVEDTSIRAFLESCVGSRVGGGIIRGVNSGEIADLLNRFGATHKLAFTQNPKMSLYAVDSYNSIMSNRNLAAHSTQFHQTLTDVKQYYRAGQVVLDCFVEALWYKT